MHPQGMVPIQAALKCCEGEMEGMGEMVCLVLGELKDRRERLGYRDQLELGEKRGSKVPGIPRTTRTEGRARSSRFPWSKKWRGIVYIRWGKTSCPNVTGLN